ncbi:MAG: cation:proton antiporter [Candidatus Binatia bacterium]
MGEEHLLLFLFQVLLLLSLARASGEVLRRWGYPPLVGEIVVGIVLGPTILGRVAPAALTTLFPPDQVQHVMLETVSWFGVLFLLLETGLEVDVSAAWRQRGPALRIGIIGVLLPLICGSLLSLGIAAWYQVPSAQQVPFALFLGTVMAISAIAVMARILHDLDLLKTDLGLLMLCGYAVNDIFAWVIFSLLLAFVSASAVGLLSILFVLGSTILFTTVSLGYGRRLVDAAIAAMSRQGPQQPGNVLTFICCLGLLCGWITQWLGLNALFGFFLAGIMAGEARALSERTRQILSQMVHAVFVPLYFASLGLNLDFVQNFDPILVLFVTVVSIVGKFIGAWLGTLGTTLAREDRLAVGIAFTPGGVTEIILAKVALDTNIFTEPVFVAVVVAALASSLLVGPWLQWSLRRRREINVAEFFQRRTMIGNLRGATRWEVIRELCQALGEDDRLPDPDTIYAAVRAREDLMGTAIEKGLAIPHARLATLTKPVLTFGRSRLGVEWNAPDGLPVHFVFLLLTPVIDNGLQLQCLAAVARAISVDDVRNALTRAEATADMWPILQDALRAHRVRQSCGDNP